VSDESYEFCFTLDEMRITCDALKMLSSSHMNLAVSYGKLADSDTIPPDGRAEMRRRSDEECKVVDACDNLVRIIGQRMRRIIAAKEQGEANT
jgi:hypothetical protein